MSQEVRKHINLILESSISRIKNWIQGKDIAGITAFRNKLQDITDKTLIDRPLLSPISKPDNIRRNRDLKATLLKLGYGVTKIAGSYVEGGVESQEESFIVVNLKDDPNFKKNIFRLSEYYNQDSFLLKSKNNENAYLIGTNNFSFPGYGNEISQGKFYDKVSAKYMSRVRGQGFAFSDENNPIEPHKAHTFTDRKKQRTMQESDFLNILEIETFDGLQNNSKRLCDTYSMELIEIIERGL